MQRYLIRRHGNDQFECGIIIVRLLFVGMVLPGQLIVGFRDARFRIHLCITHCVKTKHFFADVYGDSRPLVLVRHYVLEAKIWAPLPVCGAPQ